MALLRSGKHVNEAPQRNRSRIWSFHLYVGGALKKTLRSDVFSLDHASGLQVERGGRTPRYNSRRDVWIGPRNNRQRTSLPSNNYTRARFLVGASGVRINKSYGRHQL